MCGDFKLNLLNADDPATSYITICMNSLSLIYLTTKPTKTAGPLSTIIDKVVTSFSYEFISGILLSGISHHLPVFLIRNDFFVKKAAP